LFYFWAEHFWGFFHRTRVSEGINLVYRFILNNQKYYLRLTHAKLRSTLELQAAISYQQHLFEHDVSICQPMLSQKGLWFESVWQGEDEFLAHVCKEVPGQPINFNYSSGLYKSWGIVLGKLKKFRRVLLDNQVFKFDRTNLFCNKELC